MLFEIKSWVSGKVLFSAECESLKACVELAVSKKISLNYAELNGAELNDAGLNDAELIRIDGLKFSVIISPTHLHIGCKRFSHSEYRGLGDELIYKYDEKSQKHIVDAILNARWPEVT